MFIGLSGVALLNLGADLSASPVATVVLFVVLFVAPLTFASGSSLSSKLPQPGELMASAAQMLTAGGLFALVGLARGEAFTQTPLTASVLALYFVTFGSLLAYTYLLDRRLSRPC